MRQIVFSTIILLCTATAMSQTPIPIEAFGEQGSKAPTFLGVQLSPEFFAKSQMAALADGRNHIGILPLAQHMDGKKNPEVHLFLANLADRETQVLISVEKGIDIRNFVVPFASYDEVGLDMTQLARWDRAYIIATVPISATSLFEAASPQPTYLDLEVQEPRIAPAETMPAKSIDFCTNQTARPILMQGYNSEEEKWYTVGAFADRTNHGSGYTYYIDVHYPVYGAVFHSGYDSYANIELCRNILHTSYASATGKTLRWFNMTDLLFGLVSSASARNVDDSSEFWYVYAY